ncbi:PAS domain-containing sensor histidine kinase [Anoxynatronum buryatiense]|uniref:Circadian input-output histidine kinase CikA n=1 Tax=Anoxynatronum buryatiense TaxID=489973 RepID=A0AA45WY01_9CLOT|nr:PAS domain-containing protein [Anoxynatronum buryatiense]SMP64872.1 PAS domain S-box-containing protein [Anoxynatronum buryatiense]
MMERKTEATSISVLDSLARLQRMATEQATVRDTNTLVLIMMQQLKEISGTRIAIWTEYIKEKNALKVSKVDVDNRLLQNVIRLAGRELLSVEIPVDFKLMDTKAEGQLMYWSGLTEATEGKVSPEISAVVKRLTGLDRYISIIHLLDGQLYGTSTIGLSADQPDPPRQILEFYASLSSVSLHRNQAEAQLMAERKRLADIIEATRVGTWEWNVQTNAMAVNDRYLEMVGYTRREMEPIDLGTWYRLIHPEDKIMSNRELEAVIAGEQPFYEVECRLRHKNGHWIWIMDQGKVVRWSADGQPLLMSGTHLDITAKKEVELEIRKERDLFASGPVVFFTWQGSPGSWQVERVSANVEKLLGYTPETIMAPDFEYGMLMHPDDYHRVVQEAVEFRRKRAHHYTQTYRVRHRDGFYRWIYDYNVPEYREDNEEIRIQGYIHDETERMMSQEKLRFAKEQAETANMAKSQFLANMSHEIRTPLNGLMGMMQLLEMTALNHEQQEYLQLAKTASDSLLVVIQDILDYTRIEAGKIQLEETVFDIHILLKDLVSLFQVSAREKKLHLGCNVSEKVPVKISGDPFRLRQVLTNLVGNAIKFTERGEILIQVRHLSNIETREEELVFQVSDTGIGIPLHKQPEIFDSFQQVDSSTTRKYGGTGLGLAISKGIVEQMGGRMWVESTEGAGSTFYFTCPLKNQTPS